MTTSTLAKVPSGLSGCWISDFWGRFAAVRLVDMALRHEWQLSDEDEEIIDRLISEGDLAGPLARDDDWGALNEQGGLADKAEEWLNERLAPEGHSFGWHEGGFYLWPVHVWHSDDLSVCDCSPERIAASARFL